MTAPAGNNQFLEALSREAGRPPASVRAAVAKPALVFPRLPVDAIELGQRDSGGPIGINLAKLLDGRLLIQGTSGAGKSWTLRRLLEQTAKRLPQIVIDPEGEFRSIAESFGHLYLDAASLDPAALETAGQRARAHRVSLVLDLSEVSREQQMIAAAALLRGLVDAPREHWSPMLVAVDEAHILAPYGDQSSAPVAVRKATIGAMADLMSRGRKRGLCAVIATQRLTRLAKSVASEATNFLIGLNTLDLDIRRAAEQIGWDARKAFDRLPLLEPGEFVGVGPAFTSSPAVLSVGGVETAHSGSTPQIHAPPDLSNDDAARAIDLDGLITASAEDARARADEGFSQSYRVARDLIRDEAFLAAAQVWSAIRPLYPNGATFAALSEHCDLTVDQVVAGCNALDRFGSVEFDGNADQRAVRVSRGMTV